LVRRRSFSVFTDTPCDQWWLDYLRHVHGLDLRTMPAVPSPPLMVFDWQAG
jgi:hypothetical protein